MASAAEQLAANINFGAFAKATELKQRIWFTLAALIVYRIGTYIPLPGIDPEIFGQAFGGQANGILGMLNVFAGGAVERMSIFALNIMPYISASIIVQLLSSVVPSLDALKKEGESGRKQLNQYTRYLTVALALVQSYGIAVGLSGLQGPTGASGVTLPYWYFIVSTTITLTGSTMFLMWLGEQITARGIGNGTSLIIFTGIVAGLPSAFGALLELTRTGGLNPALLVLLLVMAIAVIAFIVFMERANRRVVIHYPRRQVGMRVYGEQNSHLPLKLNTAGVIPPIFASSLLLLPLTVVSFAGMQGDGGIADRVATMLGHGQPLYMVAYVALIVFFCFFYTAIVFNPQETADNLRKSGAFVPGIKPGKNTADYLDSILTKLTVIGAAYLAVVCLIPEVLIAQFPGVPFYFGGTSLLIVVSVTLDTVAQIHSHLLAHQYEGLIKKAKLRGRMA